MRSHNSLKEKLLKYSKNRSFIIGVAGDSGSGKTTFAKGITTLLGKDLVSGFSMDDYHKEDREQRKKSGILPLIPSANHLELFTNHLENLREGKSISKPVYNHHSGRFDPNVRFNPAPIIIIEGLHPFFSNRLRKLVDFKIFVDPSRRVKYVWKIRRDVEKRGAKPKSIAEEMMTREPQYRQYVDHQKLYADIVVEINPTKFYVNPVLQLENKRFQKQKDLYRIRLIQQLLDYPMDESLISFDLQTLLSGEYPPFKFEYYQDLYYGSKVTVTNIDGQMNYRIFSTLEKQLLEHVGREDKLFISKKRKQYLNVVEIAQILVCWRFMGKLEYLLK